MRGILILFVLFNTVLKAQQIDVDSFYKYNEFILLKQFDSTQYHPYDMYTHTGSYNMQWVQYYVEPGVTQISIDILLDYQALQVLKSDLSFLFEDLMKFFNENPVETFELFRRGYNFSVHRPGQIYPMPEYYYLLNTDNVFDFGQNRPNPQYGWARRLIRGGHPLGYRTPVAIKRVPDIDGKYTWIFSIALLMKKYPPK